MLGFAILCGFYSFVSIIPNCIASPFPLDLVGSLEQEKRPTRLRYILDGGGNGDINKTPEAKIQPRTTPGYSSDGRCGPMHEGMMCDPDSTVYIVSEQTLEILDMYLHNVT